MGGLGVLAIPVAVAFTEWHEDFELVEAGYAVPVGFALSAIALWLARRARQALYRTLGRVGGEGWARTGRVLGWLGIYIALTAAVSLAVYAYLEYVAAD